MGLGATQARYHQLRLSKTDYEYRIQDISNKKMLLSLQSSEYSSEYSNAMNERTIKMVYSNGTNVVSENASWQNLQKYNKLNPNTTLKLYDLNGEEIGTSSDSGINGYIMFKNDTDGSFFQTLLKNNQLVIKEVKSTDSSNEATVIEWSSDDRFSDTMDSSRQAVAAAEYERNMAKIKVSEQQLDTDMKAIETQYQAINTELESIKTIIDDNVKSTFNTFS